MADKPLAEKIFVGAAKGWRDLRGPENLPADRRIYMESVIDRRQDPVTERSFNNEEIAVMRDLIVSRYDKLKSQFSKDVATYRANAQEALRKANASRDPKIKAQHLKQFRSLTATRLGLQEYIQTGKLNPKVVEHAKLYNVPSYIRREDYQNPVDINTDRGTRLFSSDRDTAIGQTLGRFNYTVDSAGNINISDTYDFGPGYNTYTRSAARSRPITAYDLLPPKRAAAKLGYQTLPEGTGKGRPVSIKINSMAPKPKPKPKANWFTRTAEFFGF